jgi:hypothetical protein
MFANGMQYHQCTEWWQGRPIAVVSILPPNSFVDRRGRWSGKNKSAQTPYLCFCRFWNHCAAVALYVMHYNFCRVHEALRVTPAMQLGVTDRVWTISELVEAALTGMTQEPQGRKAGRFLVINGGKLT